MPTTRLLVVLTFRPEFTPPWGSHSYLSQLTLSRLGRSQVEAMVEKVTGGKALPKEVVQQIVSKTDGVPLFVEELTKMVVESLSGRGEWALRAHRSPTTLAIPVHLTRFADGAARSARARPKRSPNWARRSGGSLPTSYSAVSPLHEDNLQQGLKQLVDAELVYQSGIHRRRRISSSMR